MPEPGPCCAVAWTGSGIVQIMNAGPVSVVSLGAWCDLESPGTSFRVREFALLSDGREVTLLADRGWTTSAPLNEISATQVLRNVANVVLPDNAEETGEEHEWQRFEQRLYEAGVVAPTNELRALPYRVVLSDRLRSRLGPGLGGAG